MADTTVNTSPPADEGTDTPNPTPTPDVDATATDTGVAGEKATEGQPDEPEGDTPTDEKGAEDEKDEKAAAGQDADTADEGEAPDEDDLDEDDDRLDAKVRRRIREKNRENRRLRERATTAERSLMAYRVADKAGLPLSIADRLKGGTEDELAADAADMLALLGRKPRVTPTDLPADERKPAGHGDEGVNFDALVSSIYNR